MNCQYIVTLTAEERERLEKFIQKGGKGYAIRHAQILLKLDKIPENKEWTYERIGKAYGATKHTISKLAEKFVTEGLEALLTRKEQQNRCRKITGDIEARLVAIACSNPPAGCSRWTLQLLADELIRLEIVDYVTDTTVGEVLKKTLFSRGVKKNGVYQQ